MTHPQLVWAAGMAWELLGTALSPSCSQQDSDIAQLSWRQEARWEVRGQWSMQELGAQGNEDFVHTPPPCPLPGPQQALVQLCCHSLPGRCFHVSVSPLMESWTGIKVLGKLCPWGVEEKQPTGA